MKVKNLKTRIAAFGLAVLMGVSTLSSANAFAAEQTDVGQEVQASEQAVTSQKEKAVTADDITKEISDETFAAETSMEGIHYDAEKEDVTLISIQDENGGEYHPDKAGTYIASYMVVPKDQSDSYIISRKVILTDTEGQAHAQDNGGEKQKSDTKSEDDSDSPVQNYTDVEIEASGEDASAQAIEEFKEDIEEGNVMVLSAAERATSSGSTVTLTKGRTIYYPSYLGNYLTCLFTVNGKIAYCLQSQKASPPSGSYVRTLLEIRKNIPAIGTRGDWKAISDIEQPYPFAYMRWIGDEQYFIVLNPSGQKAETAVNLPDNSKIEWLAGTTSSYRIKTKKGETRLQMPATSAILCKIRTK